MHLLSSRLQGPPAASARELLIGIAVVVAFVVPALAAEDEAPSIRVARLIYAGKSDPCFAAGFLADVARETGLPVERELAAVELANGDLFRHPFAILSGEGAFELSEAEVEQLRAYLDGGGFLVASAACSSKAWADSFRRTIARLYPSGEADGPPPALEPLPDDHPVFTALYEIRTLRGRQPTREEVVLYGLHHRGRLAVVFAPMGLNDSDDAGGDCCCCGGNEIRDARRVNANLLAYALVH